MVDSYEKLCINLRHQLKRVSEARLFFISQLCLGRDLNPHGTCPHDFESCAYTNSATQAHV